jgi:outer membrane protein assembly factor BamB
MAGHQFFPRRSARALTAGATLAVSLLATVAPAVAGPCLCGSPADLAVAAGVGLDREWVVQVPFDSAGWRLEHVVVGKSLVVAQAGDGTVAGIVTAAQPGAPRPGGVTWATHAGRRAGPIAPAGIGPDLVTVVTGSSLLAFDASDGRLAWERNLRTVASAGAVPSAGWVYAPLDGGGIARYPENPLADPTAAAMAAGAAAENRATAEAGPDAPEAFVGPRAGELLDPITIDSGGEVDFPPLPYANGIAWVNNQGGVAAVLRLPGIAGRMDADLGQQVSGPPVMFAGDIILATRAGDLLRLARLPGGWVARSGTMQVRVGEDRDDLEEVAFNGWYTPFNEQPEGGPLVGRGTVVLSLGPAGIVAVSARTGDLLWRTQQPGRPLAIVGDRVWVHDASGFLTARDLATGSRGERLCLGCFTLPVVNTVSERLVLASPGGLVISLAARQTRAAEPPQPLPPPTTPADEAGQPADRATPAPPADI